MPNFPTHADAGAFASATDEFSQIGMTKREYFAAAAMQGILANADKQNALPGMVARDAVEFADSLIIALNQ